MGKKYSGKLPSPNNNKKIVNGLVFRCCYKYGTPEKTYKYDGGKPKPEYAKTIDKGCPDHDKWHNKKQRVGACCDVLPCAVLGCIGIKIPKDLADQLTSLAKNKHLKSNGHYKAKEFEMSDLAQRGRKDKSGHTWFVCEVIKYDKKKKKFVGVKYVANAHYKKLGGTYAVMDAKPKTIRKSKWKYYKCFTILGTSRMYYQIGDYGWDVLYIQQFLNWYGIKVKCNADFDSATDKAVKAFQKKVGIKPTGKVGVKTRKAMREAEK